MKNKGLFNKRLKSQELWDLTSEVLTELSRRDGVSYKVKATEESVKNKLEVLNG